MGYGSVCAMERHGDVVSRLADWITRTFGVGVWYAIGALMAMIVLGLLAGCSTIRTLPSIGAALTPDWDEATLASCWHGDNAEQRMMNPSSVPTSVPARCATTSAWQKGRGANTVHLILWQFGGRWRGGGYSIYGAAPGARKVDTGLGEAGPRPNIAMPWRGLRHRAGAH